MMNYKELQNRKFSTAVDGLAMLTDRSHTVMDGTTQYIYLGLAYPGSAESDPVWLIKRVAILADGTTATLFVDGLATFNQVWADHATLTYA
ncbi:MAG: hypothetical protein HQL96_10120 [Magnetococcales bacterium]|nr:hypothetical protein [Magnetococcales bacterium]